MTREQICQINKSFGNDDRRGDSGMRGVIEKEALLEKRAGNGMFATLLARGRSACGKRREWLGQIAMEVYMLFE